MNTNRNKKPQIKFDPAEMIIYWQAGKDQNLPRHRWREPIIFLVLLGLLAYGLFSDNFLLGIITILLGLLFYLFERSQEEAFFFGITLDGVFIQDKVHEFEDLEDFWIFYEPEGRKELSIKSNHWLFPFMHIPLGETDPSQIRQILIEFLPEEKHQETWLDLVEQYI